MISITETIAVPSPPKRVWEVLSSPSDVVSCISGAELGVAHDDGSFDGTLVVKFGALRVSFAARISLELAESELEGRLSARGRDGQRATRFSGQGRFQVAAGEGPGDSRVTVDGEIQLTGKLASLIESGAGAVVSRMAREFSAQLVQRCAEPDQPHTPSAQTRPARRRPGLPGRLRAWWARLRNVPQEPRPGAAATRSPAAGGAGEEGGRP